MLVTEEEGLALVMPQLYSESDVHGMEHSVGQVWVTCPGSFSL